MVSSQVSALGQTVLPMVAQSPAQQLVQIFQQQQQSALASGTNTIATFSAGRTTQIISNPGNIIEKLLFLYCIIISQIFRPSGSSKYSVGPNMPAV